MKAIPKTYLTEGKKHHLVSVVKDGDNEIVVSKYWRQDKRRWEYAASEKYLVAISIASERSRAYRQQGA